MLDGIFPRLPCAWACHPVMEGNMLLRLDSEVRNSDRTMREQTQDQPMCKNQKDGRDFNDSRDFIMREDKLSLLPSHFCRVLYYVTLKTPK